MERQVVDIIRSVSADVTIVSSTEIWQDHNWNQQAGFAAEISESIKTVLWAKFAFICAQAGMTAAVRLPIGEIRTVFSSLHDDLVAGRPMELEALHGLVVRRAAEHGVPVPMTEAVYAILKPWAVRNEEPGR